MKAFSLFVFALLACALQGTAQTPQAKTDTLMFPAKMNLPALRVRHFQLGSAADLQGLATPGIASFPGVYLARSNYNGMIEIIRKQSEVIANHEEVKDNYAALEKLFNERDETFSEIAKLEKERAENFKNATQSLMLESKNLNEQLNRSLSALDLSIKEIRRRSLLRGLLSGAAGGALGGLVVGLLVK